MIFFQIALSLIFLHEIDAIRCKEWRIFPGLSKLNEQTARLIFLLAHLPIFYFILWLLTNTNVNLTLRIGIDIFLIIHLVLHAFFSKHKKNEFKDWISWTVISGAA